MNSVEKMKKLIKDEEIEFIDFKIVDLFGRWRHLTIPASSFNERIVEEG
ncbi:MAG: glutamine synthetase, partial [Firmicutes bacterium]|nr:glutamine synthetase [Bacillota bacterium]